MTRIVLEPAPKELGLFRDQYDALIADLQADGYDVDLVEPTEYRGHIPGAGSGSVFYNLVVLVRESPEYPLVATWFIGKIRKRLRGRAGGHTRTGVLHLPNGEEHHFEIPEEQ